MRPYLWVIVLSLLVSGCSQPTPSSNKTSSNTTIDTTASFKIGTQWITPRPFLKVNSIAKADNDTLDIAVCADYVYSPFGKIKSKADFASSPLKNLTITDVTKKDTEETFLLHDLKHGPNRVVFFFDRNPEAWRHSYIIKGEVYNSDVVLLNGIRTGITLGDFYNVFFTHVPENLKAKYHVILFSSCVQDIVHVYTFKNNHLNSIKFINDTQIKI